MIVAVNRVSGRAHARLYEKTRSVPRGTFANYVNTWRRVYKRSLSIVTVERFVETVITRLLPWNRKCEIFGTSRDP